MSTASIINVPRSAVLLNSATQLREEINTATVAEYAEAMAGGVAFPPLVLFADQVGPGAKYLIGDGWHRLLAYEANGDVTVPAVVHVGGLERAVKYALSANARHGLKRSNADKQKAVRVALERFGELSDRAVAELCAVDHKTVAAARKVQVGNFPTSITREGKDGKQYPTGKPVVAKPTAAEAPAVEAVTWSTPLTAVQAYGLREMERQLGADITNPEKTDAELEAAARAESGIQAPVAAATLNAQVTEVRAPIPKPGAVAGGFDSAKWKLRAREVLVAWMAEVPAKHRQAAAEYLRNQVSEIEQEAGV